MKKFYITKMTKSVLHIIQTVFTGRRQGCPSQEWLEFRIKIFKEYTLKSLLAQTNRNFLHWISWRPEEEKNLAVENLYEYLKKLNYNFAFTFYGQPIWEPHSDNQGMVERIKQSLKVIKSFYKDEEFVYFTVLDSDDLFYKDAVKEIQSYDYKKNRALWFSQGYVLNTETQELCYWDPPTCPPFYTILFEAKNFFNFSRYFSDMTDRLKVHHDVPRIFDAIKLEGRKYLVTIHGKNIATRWKISFRNKLINEKEKKLILRNFGIW